MKSGSAAAGGKFLNSSTRRHYTVRLYSTSMWTRVEFTHHRGVKVRPGHAHPCGVLHGELASFTVGPRHLSALALNPGPHGGPELAVIYRPRFVAVGNDVFRVSGLERIGEPPAWVHQEWICTPGARPADIPGEPTSNRRA
jgi:hypothetical protein